VYALFDAAAASAVVAAAAGKNSQKSLLQSYSTSNSQPTVENISKRKFFKKNSLLRHLMPQQQRLHDVASIQVYMT